MNILAQLLFQWIFAALSAGTPPAQFSASGQYVGATAHATASAYHLRGK